LIATYVDHEYVILPSCDPTENLTRKHQAMPITSTDLLTTVCVTWLVLCGMMLFSRFVFQATGPRWMRGFLDTWKHSRTHRLWGIVALCYAIGVLIGALIVWRETTWVDLAIILSLVVILAADGLLNQLPSWFGNFKERMQDSWVKRHRGSEKSDDSHLFGRVNFMLGLASAAAGAFIYWYRPLGIFWLGVASVIAIALMGLLIVACRAEAGHA
jgi:hypothetical protein